MTIEWRSGDAPVPPGQRPRQPGPARRRGRPRCSTSTSVRRCPLGRDYGTSAAVRTPRYGERVGDPIPFAYPTSGIGDFRVPALLARGPDGSTTLGLRYRSHAIEPGKPDLPGLPSTYVEDPGEAETLTVTLADEPTGLEVDLRWTLFRDRADRSPAARRSGRRPSRSTSRRR